MIAMPTTFLDLPHELQRQILAHLYPPWDLAPESIPCFTEYPIYTFVPPMKLEWGPLLTCHVMHSICSELVAASFTGILDAITTCRKYSILPGKYRDFFPRVTKVVVADKNALVDMGWIFRQNLPVLQEFEIMSEGIIATYGCEA